jgi:2-oxoglutarate ferredoxin oxidoreductase subunit beta
MLKWFKENAITIKQAESLSEEDLTGKIVLGEFIQRQRPTLVETIHKTIEEAQKKIEKS